MSIIISYAQFVANQIYHPKGRYRYDPNNFGKAREKIRIFCFVHGWFWQTRHSHDAGGNQSSGCNDCGIKITIDKQKLSTASVAKEFTLHKFILLSNYQSNKKLISYRCSCGEVHTSTLDNLRDSNFACRESRYSRMAETRRVTHNEVWLAMAENGCELLSDFSDSDTIMTFRCSCGRITKKSYKSFKRSPRCRACSELQKSISKLRPNTIGMASFRLHGQKLRALGVEVRELEEDFIEAKCYRCGAWAEITKNQALHKIKSSTIAGGDANIYCSSHCSSECPVHGFNTSSMTDSRSELYVPKTDRKEIRSCAVIDRRELMRLQIDEVGYTYCEKCGTKTKSLEGSKFPTELHHSQEVAKAGKDTVSSAGHMLLCKICHKEFTSMCRK